MKTLITTIILITTLAGCKKFLEIPPPTYQQVTTSVFEDNTSANSAIIAVYTQMTYGQSYQWCLFPALLADDLNSYSTDPMLLQFFENNISPDNPSLAYDYWTTPYKFLYEVNAIIENVNRSKLLSPILKRQLLGEAKFIRAFWCFQLVNLFGDVPLVTSTDYKINALMSRTSKEQVYRLIIQDLEEAKGLLNSDFVGKDGVSVTEERTRPNKWAATALLARAYLYINDFAKAEQEASAVISNPMFKINTDLNEVFLKNSTETIWQLQSTKLSASMNTPEGRNFYLWRTPLDGTALSSTISDDLYNSFEQGDLRKDVWIGTFTEGTTDFLFPAKYKAYYTDVMSEYSMILRLAEQYLIRAEARARQDNLSGAQEDIDIIRNRADLDNTAASNKSDILIAIEHERRVELFTEWGHRWFDLKRTGRVNAVMSDYSSRKNGTWGNTDQLLPIPKNDVDKNPNMVQNPGYQ